MRTLYLSEDRETAHGEYATYYAETEPELTFYGDFHATALLDLGDADVRRHFGVSNNDFFKSFRLAARPTPSNARRRKGEKGFNFALFADSIRAPDSLAILGKAGAVLEMWP